MEGRLRIFILSTALLFVFVSTDKLSAQSKVSTNVDSIGFGGVVVATYNLGELPSNTNYILIEANKIANLLYDQDTLAFDRYADVIANLPSPELDGYLDRNSMKVMIPKAELNGSKSFSFQLEYKMLSFGLFEFDAARVVVDSGDTLNLSSEKVRVMVKLSESVLQDSTLMIADIKDIVEVKESIWSWLRYVLFGLFLVGALYYLYRVYAKRKQQQALIVPKIIVEVIPPHIVALENLTKLNREKIWLTGEDKVYQSELTYIIRQYIESRYEMNALEMTSDELLDELNAINVKNSLTKDLDDILHIADLVKFAKAKPTGSIHQDLLDKAINFVNLTKKLKV
jgi:hypothetical protein